MSSVEHIDDCGESPAISIAKSADLEALIGAYERSRVVDLIVQTACGR